MENDVKVLELCRNDGHIDELRRNNYRWVTIYEEYYSKNIFCIWNSAKGNL